MGGTTQGKARADFANLHFDETSRASHVASLQSFQESVCGQTHSKVQPRANQVVPLEEPNSDLDIRLIIPVKHTKHFSVGLCLPTNRVSDEVQCNLSSGQYLKTHEWERWVFRGLQTYDSSSF